MSTPSAPAVTPSVAASYTGSLLNVNAPTGGGTQYCYQVVARDVNGGLTAASTETCTATGATTLGLRTNTVSTITMSNNVVSVQTTAPHGLDVGAIFNMQGSSVNEYNGWFIVATKADNTHFTYQTLSDTRAGSPTSGTGGTISYWQDNHITWSAVTGAFQYYIYGRVTGGTKTLIGISLPQNAALASDFGLTYLAFDDFGPTVSAVGNKPSYIPTNPPGAATNDMLITTISSGGGTTTLTLAATAGQTVTGATILFDDALNFLTAATAANTGNTCVLLPAISGGAFVFNSPQTIPSGTCVLQKGALQINETANLTGVSWTGDTEKGSLPSFAYSPAVAFGIGTANPGVYTTANANFYNLNVNQLGTPGGGNAFVMDVSSQIPASTLENINFIIATTTDYSNMAFIARGAQSASGSVWNFKNTLLSTSQNGTGTLTACFPAMYLNNVGGFRFENLFMSGKGILMRPTVSGAYLRVDSFYTQGNYEPLFSFVNANGGASNITAELKNGTMDTTQAPIIANLGGITLDANLEGTALYNLAITGVPTATISGNTATFLNTTGVEAMVMPLPSKDGIFGRLTGFPLKILNASMALGTGYSIFSPPTTAPVAPTCGTPTSGTGPAVGTTYYAYTPIYANGSEGKPSSTCNVTTSGGNLTNHLTWPAVDGALGYNVYRGPAANNLIGMACANPDTAVPVYSDNAAFPCGSSTITTNPSGGPAGIQNNKIWAADFVMGTTAAPTGQTNTTHLYMDSTTNWPSFKPNGNTPYQLLAVHGAVTSGHSACFDTSTTGSMIDCVGGGGGTPGGSPFSSQFNNTGVFGGTTVPTVNGTYLIGYPVVASVAVAPVPMLAGIPGRTDSSATPTILSTDRVNEVILSNPGATAASIPDPAVQGSKFAFRTKIIGSGNVPTFTPNGGKTINGNATLVGRQGQDVLFHTNDDNNYLADVHDPPIICGTALTCVPGDYGLTLNVAAGSGDMIKNATNTMGASGTLDGSGMATTAGMKVPVGAGAIPTADGAIANNSTNHTTVVGSNGTTDVLAVAATGTGTATTCTNQVITAVSGIAAPTCASVSNAMLTNSSATVNGQTVTLGSTANVNVGATAHGVAINEGNGSAIAGTAVLSTNQLLAGVSAADPVAKSLADLTPSVYIAGAGSVNVMTATLVPAATANTTGMILHVLPNLANTTTTPTLNVNGNGAQTITKCGTTALVAGDYNTTTIAMFMNDGTRWQLMNPQLISCGSSATAQTALGQRPRIATIGTGTVREHWASCRGDGGQNNLTCVPANAITSTSSSTGRTGPVTGWPNSISATSAATTNQFSGYADATFNWRTGNNLYLYEGLSISTTSNIRFLVGWSDTSYSTMSQSDTVAASNSIYFRYSTAAPDTNYQIVMCGGSACTVTNTGVAANTSNHRFEIQEVSAGTWNAWIDGSQVLTNATINAPTNNTNVASFEVTNALANSAVTLNLFYIYADADH